jgi:Acetyltransferase (GNAT) domain
VATEIGGPATAFIAALGRVKFVGAGADSHLVSANPLLLPPDRWPMPGGSISTLPRRLRSDVLALADLTRRDLAAWEDLARAAISPNPFMEPDFVLPSTRAWGVSDLGVLVVRNGPEWVGAIPVRNVRSWKGVPGRCVVAWRHDYCYLGTPLVAGDDPAAVLAALVARGLADSGCMALEMIDADGPLHPALDEALRTESRVVVLDQFERAAMDRMDGGFELRLSASHRNSYARRRRQLERKIGPLETRDDSRDPAATKRFLEIEASGWKGAHGTAMACIPGHGEWFAEVCRRFAAKDRLLMLSLANDQHTMAMRCDLIAGDVLFGLEGCFDEGFSRYSPGIQLELAAAEYFSASGYAFEDSCTASDNSTLNRLWPARRRLQNVIATDRRPTTALTHAKWKAAAAAVPLRRKLKRADPDVRGH